MCKKSNCSAKSRPHCLISTWQSACDYMLPPTCKKGNCSTKPRLHCPISTRQNTCVTKRKGNQYNKKVNHINHCI